MNRKTLPAPVRPLQAGFTLVEIMVVIVILGLLATLVFQNVVGVSDEARVQTAKTNCTNIAGSVRMYRAQMGKLPDSLDVLTSEEEKSKPWYLENLSDDPWGHPYELRIGNGPHDWEVCSCGPDESPNTEDDVTSKVSKEK
jgi:general secretion pathway protein G